MKTKIAMANVKRKERIKNSIRVIRQHEELIARAMKPSATTIKTKIIEASSVAPKAFHPMFVQVMLV